MPDELPELEPSPRTTLYLPEILALGLEKFEREGLWLLLSLHHYGWRAHADMAAVLVGDDDPHELGDDLLEHHREHRAMAGLEELFLLLDQIWRLIAGIRSHRAGEGFLAGYRRYGRDVASEYAALQEMSENDWREILAIPPDDELEATLRERGVENEADIAQAHELAADVLATTLRNMEEIGIFFVRTDPVAGEQGEACATSTTPTATARKSFTRIARLKRSRGGRPTRRRLRACSSLLPRSTNSRGPRR